VTSWATVSFWRRTLFHGASEWICLLLYLHCLCRINVLAPHLSTAAGYRIYSVWTRLHATAMWLDLQRHRNVSFKDSSTQVLKAVVYVARMRGCVWVTGRSKL